MWWYYWAEDWGNWWPMKDKEINEAMEQIYQEFLDFMETGELEEDIFKKKWPKKKIEKFFNNKLKERFL
jgi:hypothetical protein